MLAKVLITYVLGMVGLIFIIIIHLIALAKTEINPMYLVASGVVSIFLLTFFFNKYTKKIQEFILDQHKKNAE